MKGSRNRDIYLKWLNNKSLRELSREYKLNRGAVNKIVRSEAIGPCTSRTFSERDFKVIRELVQTYTLSGVLSEIARIALNFGRSGAYIAASQDMRMIVARLERK